MNSVDYVDKLHYSDSTRASHVSFVMKWIHAPGACLDALGSYVPTQSRRMTPVPAVDGPSYLFNRKRMFVVPPQRVTLIVSWSAFDAHLSAMTCCAPAGASMERAQAHSTVLRFYPPFKNASVRSQASWAADRDHVRESRVGVQPRGIEILNATGSLCHELDLLLSCSKHAAGGMPAPCSSGWVTSAWTWPSPGSL